MLFLPITVDARRDIEPYLRAWKLENSTYSFTNLLIWGHGNKLRYALQDGALFVLAQYDDYPPYMYAPLTLDPGADYRAAVDAARSHMEANGIDPLFLGISEDIEVKFRTYCGDYQLTLDLDNCDYVYEAQKLITLSGKRLHAKRNHINQFESAYPNYEYVPATAAMRDDALAMQLAWLQNKDALLPGMEGEYDAIRLLFDHMDELGIVGGGIRIDGRLAAFSLGQRISERMMVVHIEKADDAIPGSYAMINQCFAREYCTDVQYINREEDMGIIGLRRSKSSYQPAFMIDKYMARPTR